MPRTVAICLAFVLSAGAALAESWQAPRLYGEGLDFGGRNNGSITEGHGPGYFPIPVQSRAFLYPGGDGRFTILVKPNIASYQQASAQAAEAARRHCGIAGGGVAAQITAQARHAEVDPESWSFAGRCR